MDYHTCNLCPRMCGADRTRTTGFCGRSDTPMAARAALHMWEEPCISGVFGSGAVFFSGCTLRCCFCQNSEISTGGFGKELTASRLSDIFLRLQDQGAHNINLVTATQFLPSIIKALDSCRHKLHIPVVYNCGGYERVEIVQQLEGYVDVWLPDFKYMDSRLSARYSQAPDYFRHASRAIEAMIRQTGAPVFQDFTVPGQPPVPLMKKGVIIRHMVLPGQKEDSIALLHWISRHLPAGQFYISLMSQYTPYRNNPDFPELNRKVTTYEYQKVVDTALSLGLDMGYMQKRSSAKEEYTPPFNLEGLEE